MRGRLRVAALALVTLMAAAPAGRAADQEDIDRAIDRGVAALKRMQQGGRWPHSENGATSLAALALLECKVPADDPVLVKAAQAVRTASVNETHTYSVALAIMFLDRLGDPQDVPLIESLAVRLLAGQNQAGGWTYSCPAISDAEVRRLTNVVAQRNELKSGEGLPKPRKEKRTVRDLPEEIQQQLAQIGRGGAGDAWNLGDNSNTQFGNLALWVARRHGLPVDDALLRVERRFRLDQNADGGWAYTSSGAGGGRIPGVGMAMLGSSSAAMTCAGLLGLAIGHGVAKEAGGKGAARDPAKDAGLNAGLVALSTVIDEPPPRPARPDGPVGAPGGLPGRPPHQAEEAFGRTYYFLWSLERVAVALNLKTIGKKDWYAWGAKLLVDRQQRDGTWDGGMYGGSGADTAFALLFLRRANLTADLTATFGRMKDPVEVVLSSGGIGASGLRPGKKIQGAFGHDRQAEEASKKMRREGQKHKPIPAASGNDAADRLSRELVEAGAGQRDIVLRRLRDTSGVDCTEALALAIPRLEGEARQKVRDALAERFKRLTAKSLAGYLEDVDPEIRRAAALATAMKDLRAHVPLLIKRLDDDAPAVVRAAHAALRALSNKDFGPAPGATRTEHEKAVAAWKAWWRDQSSK